MSLPLNRQWEIMEAHFHPPGWVHPISSERLRVQCVFCGRTEDWQAPWSTTDTAAKRHFRASGWRFGRTRCPQCAKTHKRGE